jgi:8-amino-7-oxononanoate synthase
MKLDIFDKCFNYTRSKIAKAKGYYPYFNPIESAAGNEVKIKGRDIIMIGSNNYLGLTQHPAIIEASKKAIEKYGSGCTGSRFLNGTLDIHEEMEAKLAKFFHKEAALTFSTGYQTNLGALSGVALKGDVIICDRANHASIIDGCRLSFAKLVKYKHNDMEDLERTLVDISPKVGKLIVTDGVFSMEGDIADLPSICRLAKKFGARVMVDDAHSIGVLGEGRGTAAHFGVEDQVDIIMGTFSKSFASIGGFIAAESAVIEFLKHNSRPLIFSASMAPSAVATVITALDIIEKEPERREQLWHNTRKVHEGYRKIGYNMGESATPIIPLKVGDDMQTFGLWKRLFEEGIFTNPIISPAVDPGNALLRTSYMSTHTDAELNRVLDAAEKCGRELGIIS